jgi:hypothetical protein
MVCAYTSAGFDGETKTTNKKKKNVRIPDGTKIRIQRIFRHVLIKLRIPMIDISTVYEDSKKISAYGDKDECI